MRGASLIAGDAKCARKRNMSALGYVGHARSNPRSGRAFASRCVPT